LKDPQFLPWSLGLAGLIPFWAFAFALLTGHTFGVAPAAASFALSVYAATIASFLGGMRWGLAIREPDQSQAWGDYAISVLPQLLAWATFALADRPRLVALAVLIIVTGPLDRGLVRRHVPPAWFGRLRIVLSLLAGAGLIVAAAG
jgi:Protein of unknown function (DUF3429)